MILRYIRNTTGNKNEAKNKARMEECIETQEWLHNLVSPAQNENAVSWLRVLYFRTAAIAELDVIAYAYKASCSGLTPTGYL